MQVAGSGKVGATWEGTVRIWLCAYGGCVREIGMVEWSIGFHTDETREQEVVFLKVSVGCLNVIKLFLLTLSH